MTGHVIVSRSMSEEPLGVGCGNYTERLVVSYRPNPKDGMKETILATLPHPAETTHGASVHLVTVVALDDNTMPSVELTSGDVVEARVAVPMTRVRLETAIAERRQAVVVFEDNDPRRPIIIGLIEPVA